MFLNQNFLSLNFLVKCFNKSLLKPIVCPPNKVNVTRSILFQTPQSAHLFFFSASRSLIRSSWRFWAYDILSYFNSGIHYILSMNQTYNSWFSKILEIFVSQYMLRYIGISLTLHSPGSIQPIVMSMKKHALQQVTIET